MSLAKRHFQKTMAAQQSDNPPESTIRANASQYELMQAQLHTHMLQLKKIQSVQSKILLKKELLPEYQAYLEGVMQADSGSPDSVLMTLLVWFLDVGDWQNALTLADYALRHDMTMPDRFQRTTGCVIAENVAEASIADAAISLDELQQFWALVGEQDMPDKVKAKMHKALGLNEVLQQQEPKNALNHLQTALSLDNRAGVKPQIKTLQKQLEENKPEA